MESLTYEVAESIRAHLRNIDVRGKLNFALIGAPGCGKGTHARYISEKFGLKHLSTGDALRRAVESGSELGKEIDALLKAGKFASDETIYDIVEAEVADPSNTKGVVFDGFPRNVQQIPVLENILKKRGENLTAVLYFPVDKAILIDRSCGRLTHLPSGRTYHVRNCPPKVPGLDDVTGDKLVQRIDDNEELLEKRMAVFYRVTAPILDHYRSEGMLWTFNGNEEAKVVHRDFELMLSVARAVQQERDIKSAAD